MPGQYKNATFRDWSEQIKHAIQNKLSGLHQNWTEMALGNLLTNICGIQRLKAPPPKPQHIPTEAHFP
jgi:hypothetical protein